MNIFKQLLTIFFTIYSCIVIIMTFGRYLMAPDKPVDLSFLFAIFFCSILSTIPSLIIMPRKEVSDSQMKWRYLIHFVILITVILCFAYMIGFAYSIGELTFLFFEITLIYLIVRFLTWHTDKKTSDEINECLRRRNTDRFKQ